MATKCCWWTAADGEYTYQAQALVHSFRAVGMQDDFVLFGDKPVKFAKFVQAEIPANEKWGCWFKFTYLKRYLEQMDYDYFIWLDSENFFVRKPRNILSLMHGSPLHSCLEGNLNEKCSRADWWDCSNEKHVKFFRDRGVISNKIYNLNGGFFIIKKTFIPEFMRLAYDFYEYCAVNGHKFVDEVPLAYVTQLVCGDSELHNLSMTADVWGCDWTGEFKDKVPDGSEWAAQHYMQGYRYMTNPAIVHAMRSKPALTELGKKI